MTIAMCSYCKRFVRAFRLSMIISMMGVMSRFSSTSSSTKRRSQDANCGVDCRVEYRSIRVTLGYVRDNFSVPCYTLSEYKDLHSFGV